MDLFSSHPPLAPPTSEGNALLWLRLLRSRRVGTSTFHRLMGEHAGDAAAALAALPGIADAAGTRGYQACSLAQARSEWAAARALGAVPLWLGGPTYPAALAEIDDAPILLWAQGNTDLLAHPQIALVGARNASSLGQRTARALARGLGEAGVAVVSGLARGIDTAAHKAALPTGTIGVVAGGLDIAYPRENATLQTEIAKHGLLLSEMPPGAQPQARHFPRRNRIVSGLCAGVVVVEAAPKSGSLITARQAGDQGRDVMAVPGHPFDARAAGCNMLIRDGATLVRNAQDVLDSSAAAVDQVSRLARTPSPSTQSNAAPKARPELTYTPSSSVSAASLAAGTAAPDTALDQAILNALSRAPILEDDLLRDLARPHDQVAATLLDLELAGRVARQPGGLLARAD